MTVTGSKLCVNADASKGEVCVEVRDAETGRALQGFSLGDYRGDRVIHSDDGKLGALRIGAGARFVDDPQGNDTVPVNSDDTAAAIRWKQQADLSMHLGREVRLFIQIRNADLYSFWFEK